MKRTGEIILIVIGGLIGMFMLALGGFMVWLNNNQDFVIQMYNESPEIQEVVPDMDVFIDVMNSVGMLFLISSIIVVIVGIIAIVLLKGNKKPKPAGIMLIVIAVLMSIITQGAMLFAGIFYLIAGIMALVRKAPPVYETPESIYE